MSGPQAPQTSRATLTFAPMDIDDVPLVGTMERRNYPFPWTDGIFRDCIKAGYRCERVMLDNELIGYGILQIGADEGHILNLCIDACWQRQGFARLLLEHLTELAVQRRCDTMFLEVRPSNPRAVQLYGQAGFNEVGLRRNYYDAPGGREDAIVMARSLGMPAVRAIRH